MRQTGDAWIECEGERKRRVEHDSSFGRKAGKDGANADQEKGDAEEAPGRIATVFEGTTERGAGKAVGRLGLVWV